MTRLSVDIFCRVIDNFGDAGVCWRLARQLADHPGCSGVRLYIDDLARLAHFQQGVKPKLALQHYAGVELVHWKTPLAILPTADVVIEAFACSPEASFIERMVEHTSLWINLDYLSAEPWVDSFHAQPSLQANGLTKYFFFPGFTPATGGLLREPGLIAQRQAWQAQPLLREQFYQRLQLPDQIKQSLQEGARQVSLFCYPDAPAHALVQGLQAWEPGSVVLVPEGVCPSLERGRHGKVHVVDIPFLDQHGYDQLLWSSDLNCVRGEDSLVRAIWAGHPLLWHIYPQHDQAHHTKLQAWLDASTLPVPIKALMQSWNHNDAQTLSRQLPAALQEPLWSTWQRASLTWSGHLANQPDLAHSLMAFCAQKSGNG